MNASSVLFLFMTLLLSPLLQAQEREKEESPRYLKRAAKVSLLRGDPYTAIDLYEKYFVKTSDPRTYLKLAELYRLTRDYKKAVNAYKAIAEEQPSYAPGLFYYAKMLKMNGDCDLAIKHFEEFIKKADLKKEERKLKKLAQTEIDGCRLSPALKTSNPLVFLEHLDSTVNKSYTESSPVFIDDSTFLFSALRADTVIYRSDEEIKKIPVKKFHTAYKEKGSWKYYDYLHQVFNNGKLNVVNGCYSPDRKRLYFNRCQRKRGNRYVCSVYMSRFMNNKWTDPEEISELNLRRYTSTQPWITQDSTGKNEIIFFVSDRPGGKGGLDIWHSTYNVKNKAYSSPKNAGIINTPGDESTPYYDPRTRHLYFSSDGWPGMGGLDIFRSAGEIKKPGTPVNLGAPYNSKEDDLYMVLNKKGSEGLLVSNRPTKYSIKSPTCCDDIYSFKELTEEDLIIAGRVTETADTLPNGEIPVSHTKVSLIDQKENTVVGTTTTDEKGNFTFNIKGWKPDLKIVAEKKKYFTRSVPLNRSSLKKQTLSLEKITDKAIIIKDIYYPFDESYLTEASKITIDTTIYEILVDNPAIIVELSSHTDSKGEDDYNMKLSQRRAESVVSYLIAKGIDKNRLIARGYGETRPIAANETPEGKDNPKGRDLNRRTEFRVIGVITNY